MKNSKLVLAGVALAFLSGGIGSAFAQDAAMGAPRKRIAHGHAARADVAAYRPLTVGGARRHVRGAGEAVGDAVAGPVGFGVGVAGAAVAGAATLATAPLTGAFGGPVGISYDAAPPLPIKARYARTGAVASTIAEGYTQEVPVDKSGPIYQIDNGGVERRVTPFSVLAFPVVAATSIATSPLRPVAQ